MKTDSARPRKFVGPSKRMAEALEDEGLHIEWPKTVEDEEDLAIEGLYYTGVNDYEKLVLIDLRGRVLKTKADVDEAVRHELYDAWQGYDIDEEVEANIGGNGAPRAAELLEDLQEAEKCLERFADVAAAVACGREVPPREDKAEISIGCGDAKKVCDILEKIAYFQGPDPWNSDEKAFAKMIVDELRNKIRA